MLAIGRLDPTGGFVFSAKAAKAAKAAKELDGGATFFETPPLGVRLGDVETDGAHGSDDVALTEPCRHLNRLTQVVVEAALEVQRVLGPGFAESVYEEALAVELCSRSIPFERQVPLRVSYKGFSVGEGRVDLFVDGELIVELKAVESLAPIHVAQVISYLKAMRRPLGLLITFNVHRLRSGVRRIVLSRFQ